MSENYLEYSFTVEPLVPGVEILVAELGLLGFESFVENEHGLQAYVLKTQWDPAQLDEVQILKSDAFEISFQHKEIEQVNWNAEWEKNFDPISVGDQCYLRAPFHPEKEVPYSIIIEPKMSFGTGHHETTHMMLEFILENEFEGKRVLDMGCGTAVLAILAEMRGAQSLDAIDIDTWCYENAQENVAMNHCQHINVALGDATAIPEDARYDVILANINRNILVADLPRYTQALRPNGAIYLSGFYEEDLDLIKENCNNLGLQFVENKVRNQWVAAKFVT